MGKLTAAAIRAAKHNPAKGARPIRFGDGVGLYLQVAAGDTKSWLFRYTLRGKAREMGIGPVGEPPAGVPLAKARILAGEQRAMLRDGRDPLVERTAIRAARLRADAEAAERTFRSAAMALMDSKRSGWRNAKHAAQWMATLEAHAFPVIGDLPVQRCGNGRGAAGAATDLGTDTRNGLPAAPEDGGGARRSARQGLADRG